MQHIVIFGLANVVHCLCVCVWLVWYGMEQGTYVNHMFVEYIHIKLELFPGWMKQAHSESEWKGFRKKFHVHSLLVWMFVFKRMQVAYVEPFRLAHMCRNYIYAGPSRSKKKKLHQQPTTTPIERREKWLDDVGYFSGLGIGSHLLDMFESSERSEKSTNTHTQCVMIVKPCTRTALNLRYKE